ncbi:LysR family transcriptional regulator [Beijerinckia sp. L45]|uniref:LysR family transcriptional regulator n=1 Tax=Beijerinckia sp. L45 TaxID=1641855 RepID=UPI00131E5522|nr:LysR family transcriptional regulator [Beijerinckia sp. L45]
MFDVNLLHTFITVVETRSFTDAGRARGLSQSTVSQHIRRLEEAAGCQLLARDTHGVALTADGTLMANFAHDIVEVSQRAADYFADVSPRGRVRFGVSEDLALTRLPGILKDFIAANPLLNVELRVGLTSTLYQSLDSGQLDLIFAKRRADDDRGTTIWREKLAWMAAPHFVLDAEAPVPLVLYTSSSITSALTIDAFNRSGRSWVVTCSSETLSGLRAATLAGLGIAAQSRLLLRQGDLVELSPAAKLPDLGDIEFVILGRSAKLQGATAALAEVIAERGPALWATL